MVSIISSFTVVPSKPTSMGSLFLSESDQINAWTHAPTIYVYTPQPSHTSISNAIERMRDSLSNILVHFYPLAGRLRWIGGGRLEVDCNEAGVTLLEAKSSKKLDDYGDFRPNESIQELVPKADYTKPIEEQPLLLLQLTKFSCGGVSIGVSISLAIVDGVAGTHFINSWAKLSRGETLEQDDMPFLDRTVLKCREPLMPPRFNHPEFEPLPVLLGASDDKAERKKETTVELFKLTEEQVNKIKKKTTETKMTTGTQRPYSRYEAITAHIWKSASKSRQSDYNQPTAIRILADIRNRLNPPLPRNYFGNAIVRTYPRCLAGDIISNPLSYAAQRIREGVEILTDEYVRSQLDFLASCSDVNSFRDTFPTLDCAESPFVVGNPNLSVGSWTSMVLYGADFGWGKPVYMGPGSLNEDGKGFIMSTLAGDGSVAVVIRLQKVHMEDFKKFFYDI